MGIHNVVPVVSAGYTLIYNGVDEGVEFAGSIQSIGGATCIGIIAGSLPDADAQGFVINSQTPVQLVVSSSLKLYVKGQSSDTNVILIDNSAGGSTNPATLTSRSGTIATGGTAQQLMAANAARKGWWLQNLSTGDLWVNRFGGTASAAQPNIQIPSGALYETPAGGAGSTLISIYGATTGQAFASGEW
jgi:hypothetical protein